MFDRSMKSKSNSSTTDNSRADVFFQPPMDAFCEQIFTVSKAFFDDSCGTAYYRLYEVPEWSFTDEMLEDPSVREAEIAGKITMSFEDFMDV